MANSGAGLAILISIVLLAGALLFSGPILAFIGSLTGTGDPEVPPVSDIFAQITNGIKDFLAQIGLGTGGSSDDVSGSMSVGFIVHYTNGDSEQINMNMAYSVFPYSVSFNGKQVESIESCFLAKMNCDINSYSANVKVHTELYKKPAVSGTPLDSSTVSTTKSGSNWQKGTIEKVASYTVTGTRLDTIMAQHGNGNYLLQVSGAPEWGDNAIVLTAMINGEQVELTANPKAIGLDLQYSDGTITGATLSISQLPTQLSIIK